MCATDGDIGMVNEVYPLAIPNEQHPGRSKKKSPLRRVSPQGSPRHEALRTFPVPASSANVEMFEHRAAVTRPPPGTVHAWNAAVRQICGSVTC